MTIYTGTHIDVLLKGESEQYESFTYIYVYTVY